MAMDDVFVMEMLNRSASSEHCASILSYLAAWSPRHRLLIRQRLLKHHRSTLLDRGQVSLLGWARESDTADASQQTTQKQTMRLVPLLSACLLHEDEDEPLLLSFPFLERVAPALLEAVLCEEEQGGHVAACSAHVLERIYQSPAASAVAVDQLRERLLSGTSDGFRPARLSLAYALACTFPCAPPTALPEFIELALRTLTPFLRRHHHHRHHHGNPVPLSQLAAALGPRPSSPHLCQ